MRFHAYPSQFPGTVGVERYFRDSTVGHYWTHDDGARNYLQSQGYTQESGTAWWMLSHVPSIPEPVSIPDPVVPEVDEPEQQTQTEDPICPPETEDDNGDGWGWDQTLNGGAGGGCRVITLPPQGNPDLDITLNWYRTLDVRWSGSDTFAPGDTIRVLFGAQNNEPTQETFDADLKVSDTSGNFIANKTASITMPASSNKDQNGDDPCFITTFTNTGTYHVQLCVGNNFLPIKQQALRCPRVATKTKTVMMW